MRVVCTCNDDHGIIVGHAIPQVLAVIAFDLVTGGFHLARILVLDLTAAGSSDHYITVHVVAHMGYFVEHEPPNKTARRVAGALIAAEVVQSLTQIHACIGPYCWLPDWLGLGWSVGAVGEELVSNLVELLLAEGRPSSIYIYRRLVYRCRL
jgi:hypothetical protein